MIKKSQIYFVDEVFDQEKKEEDNNMHIPSQTPPKTPKGGSSAERNDKITIDVEAKGLEEAIEQVEDLREAISTAPRVVIKNPRDCTITVDGSEYNPPQQVAQPEPEGIEGKKDKLRAILYHLQVACLHTHSCKECPLGTEICDEGGEEFYPARWRYGQ